MSAPRINLSSVLYACQKLSHLVDIRRTCDKNNFAQFFFETRCRAHCNISSPDFTCSALCAATFHKMPRLCRASTTSVSRASTRSSRVRLPQWTDIAVLWTTVSSRLPVHVTRRTAAGRSEPRNSPPIISLTPSASASSETVTTRYIY